MALADETPFIIHTRDHAKALARIIRAELAAARVEIDHAAALERVARAQGFQSWNVLSAQLSNEPKDALQVGAAVRGYYLKRAFAGVVRSLQASADGRALLVTVEFDAPVNVSAFQSFEVLRRRVTSRISPGGVSFAKTSDGAPHFVVMSDRRGSREA